MGRPLGVSGGCQATRREVELIADTVTFRGADGTVLYRKKEREKTLIFFNAAHTIEYSSILFNMIFRLEST